MRERLSHEPLLEVEVASCGQMHLARNVAGPQRQRSTALSVGTVRRAGPAATAGPNTAIISPGGGNVGIGFAVPINMAGRLMEQLVATGKVERGRIGVVMQDVNDVQGAHVPGVRIAEVTKDSSAERAGLRKGDIVTSVNDAPIRSAGQLRNAIGLARVGERVRLAVLRDRARLEVTVDVAESRSSSLPRGQSLN